jgi:hypothetical protein
VGGMPLPERPEYNPFILGFVEDRGPVFIPLQTAREMYGRLPSEFQFVPAKDGRTPQKGLNLAVGKMITDLLGDGVTNLKGAVCRFFSDWHRDYRREFGVDTDGFQNLNAPGPLLDVILRNRQIIVEAGSLSLRDFLARGHVRKDVLNSIPDSDLSSAAQRMLARKVKSLLPGAKRVSADKGLALVRSHAILRGLQETTGCDMSTVDGMMAAVYADEMAAALIKISARLQIDGVERLSGVRGAEVVFEYAARDRSYLLLGKQTGDCTADKKTFQADRDIENIYWTVFPWIIDRNYQILKVYYRGDFVMKAHLMPLFVIHEGVQRVVLAVDAVETILTFREDLTGQCRDDLLENRTFIFDRMIEEIRRIAWQMGIDRIYAEKFSNTGWVRDAFGDFPEIYLRVANIIKLDELEDIYCFSRELCQQAGRQPPSGIFMEVQTKNISLLPQASKKMEGVKSFAVIDGDPGDGLPLKRVFGI